MCQFNHQQDDTSAAWPIIKAFLALIAVVGAVWLIAYLNS